MTINELIQSAADAQDQFSADDLERFARKMNTTTKQSDAATVAPNTPQAVVTYQSPSGSEINLTPKQIRHLEKQGVWLRDDGGQEYCTVSHGRHFGAPTFATIEALALATEGDK